MKWLQFSTTSCSEDQQGLSAAMKTGRQLSGSMGQMSFTYEESG